MSTERAEARRDAFVHQVRAGIDFSAIERLLEHEHDVYPARIETDIRHQSSLFYRAVVELVSNAIDASSTGRTPIGRFGVGFYQILNHLQAEGDRVLVTTRTLEDQEATAIEFRMRAGILECKITQDQNFRAHGTTVELRAKHFSERDATSLLGEALAYNQDAQLVVNGARRTPWRPTGATGNGTSGELPRVQLTLQDGLLRVEDAGTGMSAQSVFERLLVPKVSGKPSLRELRSVEASSCEALWEAGDLRVTQPLTLVLMVGGIVIERIRCSSCVGLTTLVVDLPPSTVLAEQRDAVAVDAQTIKAMRSLIDKASERAPSLERDALFNSLFILCQKLQGRSTLSNAEDNLVTYMRASAARAYRGFELLPNQEEFFDLQQGRGPRAFLNPELLQMDLRLISGLTEVESYRSSVGESLVRAQFREGAKTALICSRGWTILDERIEIAGREPQIAQLMRLSQGDHGAFLYSGGAAPTSVAEARTITDPHELIRVRFAEFGFSSIALAERELETLCRIDRNSVNLFTTAVLARLPIGACFEGWSILRKIILDCEPPQRLPAIKVLSATIDAFSADSDLWRTFEVLRPAIFSSFERRGAHLPAHLRAISYSELEPVRVGGDLYYLHERNDNKRFIREDGTTVEISHDGYVLFRGNGCTIYRDGRLVSEGGAELKLPDLAPWGTLRFGFEASEFSRPSREGQRYSEVAFGDALPIRGPFHDAKGQEIKLEGGRVLIDGREAPSGEGVQTCNLVRTISGQVLALQHSARKRYSLNDSEGDASESYQVVSIQGEVVWRYRPNQWPPAVLCSNKTNVPELERTHLARCFPFNVEGAVEGKTPIIGIYSWVLGAHRHLILVGYVTANGTEVRFDTTDERTPLALRARYVSMSSCSCCGKSMHLEVGTRSIRDDERAAALVKEQLLNFQMLGVDVVGEFIPDSQGDGWIAWAQSADHKIGLARFDRQGQFKDFQEVADQGDVDLVNNAELASSSASLRNTRRYLASRLPRELQKLTRYEKAGDERLLEKRVKSTRPPILEASRDYGGALVYEEKSWVDSAKWLEHPLSKDQARDIGEFLRSRPRLDRELLERLLVRSLENSVLPTSHFKALLQAFYEFPYVHPSLRERDMTAVLARFQHLDPARQMHLLRVLNEALPSDEKRRAAVGNKIVDFYLEKMADVSFEQSSGWASSLTERVAQLTNGVQATYATIIRHATQVPEQEVPRELRALVLYLTRSGDELAYDGQSPITFPEGEGVPLRLSEIVQWKRLREGVARSFDGSPEELSQFVHAGVEGSNTSYVQREITHAIHFQTLDAPDLYIRELVQNSVDALKSAGMPDSERVIDAKVFVHEPGSLFFEFQDPVGMNVRELLNYFLIPGDSSKVGGGFIGFYGQGLYTLFLGAKEVLVKTGDGSGKTWYLRIEPVIEDALVVDLKITLAQTAESFRGTVIVREQESTIPRVEAAHIRASFLNLVGGLDATKAVIRLQGDSCNHPNPKLWTEEAGDLGEVQVYRNQNGALTHNGLFLKVLPDFGLPSFMHAALKKWGGIVVDLPPSIELTRSRRDIASYERIKPMVEPAVRRALTGAYLEGLSQRLSAGETSDFPFPSLPYDYFIKKHHYAVDERVKQDVEALGAGEGPQDVTYYQDTEKLIQLLVSLPFVRIQNECLSLEQLKARYQSAEFPFSSSEERRLIPRVIARLIEEQEMRHGGSGGGFSSLARAGEFTSQDVCFEELPSIAHPPLEETLKKYFTSIAALERVSSRVLELLDAHFWGAERATPCHFYWSDRQTLAHASRWPGGSIAWNVGRIGHFLKGASEDGEQAGLDMECVLETLVHEYAHTLEGWGGWTHNVEFDKRQAAVLAILLRDGELGSLFANPLP
jgi:hypothetical protein